MDMDWSESRHDRREERDDVDDKVNGVEKSSKHTRKKSGRGEERERERDRDHKSKDRERSKKTSDNDVGKDKSRDSKVKDKEYDREKSREKDKDRKDRGKEKERERDRDREKKEKERDRVKEKEKHKDREKDRYNDKERERGREKTKERERDREADQDKERSREKDRASRKGNEEDYDDKVQMDYEDEVDKDNRKQGKVSFRDEGEQSAEGAHSSASELEQRILKMKEERTKKKSEAGSDILAWVGRSRKIEENKHAAKARAKHLSKIFEEQDNIGQGGSDDEEADQHNAYNLAGIKVLDGLDKVLEGGAVVLTLKDQNILADGDINEEVDMLENVEIGEQKRRDEAYKAAKKKTGIYDDKFNDDPASEKKMLPQYDDANADEGITLDERGRFTGEAEKKLEELRRRLQGTSTSARLEDLNSSGKISSDYFTHEEMLKFKKPKKKKSLRKKDKLDIDALEAEAVSAGLGIGDLGSRKDGRRQAIREEQERSAAEMRNNAYQSAYAKADEASKSLRLDQTLQTKVEEEENLVFADDEEDLYKSLERARKLALKKQEAEASGPLAIAHLASTTLSSQIADDKNPETGESHENKLVFTEMEEFVSAIQLAEEVHKPDNEDVFMDEDEPPRVSDEEQKDEAGGWMEVPDNSKDENPVNEDEEIVPDETIHEVAVGKGLSGALKLLKERGTLKESIDWGGRNMDKKKSKLVGIVDDDVGTNNDNKFKDIRIERTDEFGRIMTPKEAFRMISHKFHGKGPGKMKQEKRMKQYQEELKLKQMKNSDTPSLSVERMRGAQAQLKTPYLVLSGHVKPGQTSDPRSGFATVEKDFPGGLTPMLGDKKVEHFLGIKRKPETGFSGAPKKPKI
ncbi:PREDICTED: SART-1 family protein DOT2 isoform X1 [Populus euphratica]|uniref:SART-1 family protein DOT2 isoform X1 n=1 Tax=Populus euphratica TaxID=75702 RepID=A0AAJ6THU8_POPEU|nr:PREDICTED: SART-1 family protein DOT2 isoform X1 [Populus euphratica]